MRSVRKSSARSMPVSAYGLMQRFSLGFSLMAALLLLFLSLVNPAAGERVRLAVTDTFSPLLSTLSAPVTKVVGTLAVIGNLTELRAENERLMIENQRLRTYQSAALHLEAENKGLRDLLKLPPDPTQTRISARIIADVGGPFVRNLIVMAGTPQGVRSEMAVLSGEALVGRVMTVGQHSARVLMINDINARVPVLLESSRTRAMVIGNNMPTLQLSHLPPGAVPAVGERLMTSGVGGVYPAGIPVGVVSQVSADGAVTVQPFADLGRLEFVQIVDAGQPSDVLSPEASAQPAPAVAVPPVTSSPAAPLPLARP